MSTIDGSEPFYPIFYITYVLTLAPVSSALRRSYGRDTAWTTGTRVQVMQLLPKV